MNVFRSRKKSIGEADASRRPSIDDAPPMPKSARSLFSRKKPVVEEKPQIDLATVLPSDNEFRTSLIMPNLSQRFSMLREQDDPKSKLGKASDDSVLQPRRASRLNLFEGTLDDIAEVSSLAGSFKPPFAQNGSRVTSYASDGGYESDGGTSIMSRAKPGQGNKFFGGRQKVYKIPTAGPASRNNSRPGSAGKGKSMGRAVYEDDISTSLWQKLKQEEKAKMSFDYDRTDHGDERWLPATSGYDRKRETSSSTNSNDRQSTAATSTTSMPDGSMALPGSMIKEQARDRPLNKRMYGQGIDQQVFDSQSSALQRLNSVRTGRGGFSALAPVRAPSSGNRPGAISVMSSSSSMRSDSPSSPAVAPANGFDFGLGLEGKPSPLNIRAADSGYLGTPEFTPPISPADPTLAAHLDPNDHGKATASGAFNKPKARYDEQQFAQRQLQLQEGRETPIQSSSRSETPNELFTSRFRQSSDVSAGPEIQSRALNFSRSSNGRSPSGERRNGDKRITDQALDGAFLAELSDSEDTKSASLRHSKSFDSYKRPSGQSSAAGYQDDIHPALRIPIEEEDEALPQDANSQNFESPTLGQPSNPTGLSAMVRGHLRNMSDASSVYPDSPPPERDVPQLPVQDENVESPDSHADVNGMAGRARQLLDDAKRMRSESNAHNYGSQSRSPPVSRPRQDASPDETARYSHHTRGPSVEAQQERDAFADELAERRRQVEQKLKNIAESRKQTDGPESYSRDPSPGRVLIKKQSKTMTTEPNGALGKIKKFMPGSASASGATTPVAEQDALPEIQQMPFDTNFMDRAAASARSADKAPIRERNIAAERRARHAEGLMSPRGTGAPPPRGRVDVRRQQFAAETGNIPKDFTQRINANPDQGKPHFHPAGRARHYSPPRTNQTPEQRPMLPPQGQSQSPRAVNKAQIGRPGAPIDQTQFPRQASTERTNMTSPPLRNQNCSPFGMATSPERGNGAQMITPGTFPPPVGSPVLVGAPSKDDLKHVAARKRSVSKAEISNPTFLSGTYDQRGVVDLPAGASLENGMAEVRARDAAMSPPPLPPINPRRRAMNTIKGLTRSNTGSADGELGPRGGSPVQLRRQMSEGASLRGGNSPVRGY